MKYTVPKGCKDILGEDAEFFRYLEDEFAFLCRIYNFKEVKTPFFESADLFLRSLGEETEIITKQMYLFKDKADRLLALRPEGTAPVIRAYLENNLDKVCPKTKFFYTGAMFRYERPQAGRQRQFHQLAVEYFGEESVFADLEIISLAVQFIKKIGIENFTLEINSVGCKNCQPKYANVFKNFIEEKKDLVCVDCKDRVQKNVLRILDCKNNVCKELLKLAPVIRDYECENCKKKYSELKNYLTNLNLNFGENNFLIRGLDYYTQCVFEITHNELGAQNAICGGGRYNNLVEELGGLPISGCGFALGMERLILILKNQQKKVFSFPLIYVAVICEEAKVLGLEILKNLREKEIATEFGFNKNLKLLLKKANNLQAKFVIILGEEEINTQKIIFKNMQTKEQIKINFANLVEEIKINLKP